MEQEPNDVIVLSAISKGAKKFDKIIKVTKISSNELNDTLQRLENRELIVLAEKKGFFGPKKELSLTEKGSKELEIRKFELEKNWDNMVTVWKSEDKQKLQQCMEDNRSIIPSMMFLGIMDMMMFSTMMGFMGMAMSSFIPDTQVYGDSHMSDTGHDIGSSDHSGGDMGHGDGGPGDMGGFDVNF
ncbi:MAG TPA: winged helix-turn-helix transcriptional regulator [Nitrosopumilaceae archaeon]|nr:winged helix-turn-helix transcriptional regulator [Nitrosopumilaceae archaeon]